MAIETEVRRKAGPRLKVSSGWFAAGASFQRALTILSDGAFRLFAYLCMEADRETGRYAASQTELARVLGRSRRIIGRYIVELEREGICRIHSGKNQYDRNSFEILDDYWPYCRNGCQEEPQEGEYVARVRKAFLTLGCCTKGSFGPSDKRFAEELEARGIPIVTIEDAMVLAAVRKYISWLNNGPSEPIGSLRYVEPIITETQEQPWPADYREYLQENLRRCIELWQKTGKGVSEGGTKGVGSTEIVDPGHGNLLVQKVPSSGQTREDNLVMGGQSVGVWLGKKVTTKSQK